MTVCRNCEENMTCDRQIRNSKSNNVWPSFPNTWSTADPRSTKSMRGNTTTSSMIRKSSNSEKITPSTQAGCPCKRRICKSWKRRNFVVSFGDLNERSNGKRISGGDAEENSTERMSSKSFRSKAPSIRCPVENKKTRDPNELGTGETRRTGRKGIKGGDRTTKKRFEDFEKTDSFDLLYDRSNETKNSVSFCSASRDSDTSVSKDDEHRSLVYPSNTLDELETKTRMSEPKMNRFVENCHSAREISEKFRGGTSRREFSRHREPIRDHASRESSEIHDIHPSWKESRESSFEGTNRFCKDCSRLVSFLGKNDGVRQAEDLEEPPRNSKDLCAIKHKDSMAILVEKFKNKKISCPSDDETTISKSDEDYSANGSKTGIVKKMSPEEEQGSENCRGSSTEENDNEEIIRWKNQRQSAKSIVGMRKASRSSKTICSHGYRGRPSSHCCSANDNCSSKSLKGLFF